ncbi:uncharacterized protein LOC135373800 [Ornithodoros turicata]|uniref:uncharacterized protein LOC135373800 n=1 Tax=Ornithodoros turicata TaxID=34597 RepID=UPI003139CC8F
MNATVKKLEERCSTEIMYHSSLITQVKREELAETLLVWPRCCIRSSRLLKNDTDSEIEAHIRSWLRHAKEQLLQTSLQCNQKTISDAEDVCLRKYEQEHGIISRGLMSGNDKRLCCTLDYKKNCVPDQLKAKGCDEQLLQNYVAKIQREITNQCAASNSICDVASKCPNKTLSLAQTVCEESFMREHGLVLPPEYVNKEANKWYCCMMQYSQNCLQDTLKQQGCDSEDFLQVFTRKVETQCGTSKPFCSAQCNNNTLSHAQFACSERYMQIHVLNPEKPGELSPDTQKLYCWQSASIALDVEGPDVYPFAAILEPVKK